MIKINLDVDFSNNYLCIDVINGKIDAYYYEVMFVYYMWNNTVANSDELLQLY